MLDFIASLCFVCHSIDEFKSPVATTLTPIYQIPGSVLVMVCPIMINNIYTHLYNYRGVSLFFGLIMT